MATAACLVAASVYGQPPARDTPWHDRLHTSGLALGKPVAGPSKENSLLAFSAFFDGNWDIFTWDFDSSHAPVQITHTPYDEADPTLAWDHAFCVYQSVDGRLWRVSLDQPRAPQALPFASDQRLDMHPALSPKGDALILATSLDRTSDDTDLIVYRFGSKSFGRRLELMSFQHYPGWAPDGLHVAFSNLHGRLQTGSPIAEIWVMRAGAPWARQLTVLDSLSISPAWSPDGRLIAFASNRGGAFNIWLVDPVTRAFRRFTDHQAADTDPVFDPSGRTILYVSARGSRLALWRQSLDSHQAQPVHPFGEGLPIPCKDPDWK